MTKNEEFFIQQSIRHARSLRCREAAAYLSGMIMACGEIEIPQTLRDSIQQIIESDRQLHIIASQHTPTSST